MSLLDKKQCVIANLSTGEVANKNVAFYYDTDKNIAHIYLRLKVENEDGSFVFLSSDDMKDLNVKLLVITPNNNADVLLGNLLDDEDAYRFDLKENLTTINGKYRCKLSIAIDDEVSNFNNFYYVINESVEHNIDYDIINDEKYPILVKLINDVENIQKSNLMIEDSLTSNSDTLALSAKQGKILNDRKVNKISGKGLSTNDFTDEEKEKLDNMSSNANNYTLPIASASVLGGIKIGSGLIIDGDGVVSTSSTGGGSSVATIPVVDNLGSMSSTSALSAHQGKILNDNKVDKINGKGLSTNDFSNNEKNKLSSIENNANYYTLPMANASTLGGVKVGNGLHIDNAGLLNLNLPVASATTLGGIKIGKGLNIDNAGILSLELTVEDSLTSDSSTSILTAKQGKILDDKKVDKDGDKMLTTNDFTNIYKNKLDGIENNANNYTLPVASASVLGGIKVGEGLSINSNGVLKNSIVIEDSLTNSSTTRALSAKQGKALNDNKVDKDGNKVLTTNDLTNELLANLNSAYEHSKSKHFSGKYSDLSGAPTPFVLNPATATTLGGVKVGEGLNADSDGTLKLKYATWVGTQSEYDAIETKDDNTFYFIKEG